MFNTPILLITFNRPTHVSRVLEVIMRQQPKDLYVFQDGAREGNEADLRKCAQVREVVEKLTKDTATQLHTFFSDKNLGCGPGPYTAMSWFFSQVEYGIVLEDDLDPHPLFFEYMENLLNRYKDESRIGLVTAHNQKRIYTGKNTYYFTFNMSGTLGWGTWRRVWKNFDFNIKYDSGEFDRALKLYYGLPKPYRDYENGLYAKWMVGSRRDVWDHMWKYYLLVNGFIDVKPNCCLVSHLGTDADATHTGYSDLGYMMDVKEELFNPIQHPIRIGIDSFERKRAFKKSIKIIVKRFICKAK